MRAVKSILLILVTLGHFCVQAQDHKNLKAQSIKIFKNHSQAAEVKFEITKKDIKKTLGTESSIEAVLNYSQGRIFYSVEKPNKVEIIFNKKIWLIEYPDLELDPNGKRKVTIFESNKVLFIKKMSELLSKPESALSSKTTYENANEKIIINLPDAKDQIVKQLKVVLNKKTETLDTISFEDDIGTETIIKFEKTTFEKKTDSKKFNYKKQKTDEVIKP